MYIMYMGVAQQQYSFIYDDYIYTNTDTVKVHYRMLYHEKY